MSSRKKGNVEGDRLSRLPDDLIHKIMSFVSIKQAVETSVLSPRWRYIWTSMPYLSFSSNDFRTLPKFSNFVKHVLSSRNNQVDVFSVDLTFRGKVSQAFVKRILDYAFSHNVQQLNFTCIHDKNIELPLSLFSSRSLKHLSLTGYSSYSYEHCIMTPPTWELPALATLNLHCVTLHDKGASLFSHCANLKNLTLKSCTMMGLDTSNFKICHPGLSSLTLEDGYDGIDVVTPQLKNLIIKGWQGIHLISAPNLSSLHYIEDSCSLKISADLLYLEKVDVCISYVYDKAAAHEVVSLLQQLYSCLSSYVELISHQPSPFTDLKSLKIYPTYVPLVGQTQPKLTLSPEVEKYLLGSSPGATFTTVSHEEIRAVKNVTSARNLMLELRVLLDQWKENNETDKVCMKQDKALMKGHTTTVPKQGEVENCSAQRDMEMKCHFGERITHIESYWKDLNSQVGKGYNNTCRTISLLRKIEGVLKEVPRSHRAKLQARFSSLRVFNGVELLPFCSSLIGW
uniref:Putative F-box domain, Leucine-rich repeat domain, L domain-like protein n=1 Tax=Helianthus annuus TaxID=4232 RepID=A0A251RLI6_HELAN